MTGEGHDSDGKVQPGVSVSRETWERFRQNVKQRRGRVNGVLSAELEDAIEAYLDGAEGGDVTDELRRLREDVKDIHDEVIGEGATPPASDGGEKKRKNSRESGKESPEDSPEVPTAGTGDADNRSIVEKRTDETLAELLVGGTDQFMLDELDDAIETGAGVMSDDSKSKYRKRVFDRLGGKEELEHRRTRSRPLEQSLWFTDADQASVENAKYLIARKAIGFDTAVEKEDADPETVRTHARERRDAAIDAGETDTETARLVEEAGFDLPDDVDVDDE